MNKDQVLAFLHMFSASAGTTLLAIGTPTANPYLIGAGLLLAALGGVSSFNYNKTDPVPPVAPVAPNAAVLPGFAPVELLSQAELDRRYAARAAAALPTPEYIAGQPPASPSGTQSGGLTNASLPLVAFLILGALSFGLVGCQSTPGGSPTPAPSQTDVIAAVIQPLAKNAVLPVLLRNPTLEPVFVAMTNSIDAIFAKGSLTPQDLATYLSVLDHDERLTVQDRVIIASAIQDAWTFYTQTYGKQVATTADPNAVKLLNAFKQGILDGIATYHAFAPQAAAKS